MSHPVTFSDFEMPGYDFHSGSAPLLVSMPHVGTRLPKGLHARLSEACALLGDTDWHLPRLYDFVRDLGASVIVARYTRFTVDLNRPPDDAPLYTTATTGLHPETLFDGRSAFRAGQQLSADERARFLEGLWRPYHHRIAVELASLRERHGHAVLFDAHSIAGEIPRLFDGVLPDFNIGTADGRSADAALTDRLAAVVAAAPQYRSAVNGRFKGGYITRHYGDPAQGIHAVQLELAQRTYMHESPPYDYVPEKAEEVRPVLRRFVETMLRFRP